ncbi:MAG: DEAD/DEAH box helicase family protein [Mucispirillum sp.]|nr:DEAD/DEAH box helicase family protein [Mucispirillum sp.]
MNIFDNNINRLFDDLVVEIKKGSVLSIASASFSIYSYHELKKQLESIDELRFIFTSPVFVKDSIQKEKREFYIPKLERERNLYGTPFELRLRNGLTQKVVARECAEWVKSKVKFKSNISTMQIQNFMVISQDGINKAYTPIDEFSTVSLGLEKGNNLLTMINKIEYQNADVYLSKFQQVWQDKDILQDVTESVIDSIANVYKENSPDFIYFVMLYNIFHEFLEDISEDNLPNEATGFKDSKIWNKLFDFQKEAFTEIYNKLEKYNGCILADSVGLGKTFTALAVIKYYENRGKNVLVLCPKKLSENWLTYRANYINNPVAEDRLRYDVLCHTDLSRNGGMSNGLDLSRVNWGNYDLVVIDESHNFRNGGNLVDDDKQNRYTTLMRKIIKAGVKTKVLMLSATPVNNRFIDLKNQLALAYEGDTAFINSRLKTERNIDDIFRSAQAAFNKWSKNPPEERTTANLLDMLDNDFFELLDSVTIARSRKHIANRYNMADIGKFPKRLKPKALMPKLTDLKNIINYSEIYDTLSRLNLSIYTPSFFIHPSKIDYYEELANTKGVNLTMRGREKGVQKLMAINLLKRLESSVYSFRLTLKRIMDLIDEAVRHINNYETNSALDNIDVVEIVNNDLDEDDKNTDFLISEKSFNIKLSDMDYITWRQDLLSDKVFLENLYSKLSSITKEHDSKLSMLKSMIDDKINNPINAYNKKILIFTAFADTAEYLYNNISKEVKAKYGLNTGIVSGSNQCTSTAKGIKSDFSSILMNFSPISKERDIISPNSKEDIDILIATDCISEGQNLQDCDYLINYDIHWNPVRIIQRFGRIDRIGSKNECIQLVNFWPDINLDEYINLKATVETRMRISVMTATGDDDLINENEKGDLEYRRLQLERLKNEIVDIEDMTGGVSIMDLGLNEFRLDLLDYMKTHNDIEHAPYGMHAVVQAGEEFKRGAIYILKNRVNDINIQGRNRLHPFYMVYILEDGSLLYNHLQPKELLDVVRYMCKGKEIDRRACHIFNTDTQDGKNMAKYSSLLTGSIESMVSVQEESNVESFLKGRPVSFIKENITGIDDFELICFIAVV